MDGEVYKFDFFAAFRKLFRGYSRLSWNNFKLDPVQLFSCLKTTKEVLLKFGLRQR